MNDFRLRRKMLILVGIIAASVPVRAADMVWQGPGSDFDDAANWSVGVPQMTDNAVFSNTGPTDVTITTNTTISGLRYASNAGSYTTTLVSKYTTSIGWGGIQNQSAHLQSLDLTSNSELFMAGLIAGNVQLSNMSSGFVWFASSGSFSGNVSVVNVSTGVILYGNLGTGSLDAGHAQLGNTGGGTIGLNGGFFGDLSTMHNDSGTLVIGGNADLSSMTVTNAGAITFVPLVGSSVTIGSLSGSGTVELTASGVGIGLGIGSNSADTEISGVISGVGGSLIKVGTGTLTLSGANIYTGGTVIANGTLQVNTTSLPGDVEDNAALVFNQSFDGLYGGVISGSGQLIKRGSGEVELSNANSIFGNVYVEAGTLDVSGSLNTNIFVEAGGTLSGTGQVGPVNNSGTLLPGTAGSGSLTVASYRGSGALEIPFDNMTHPLLSVTGAATLTGGTLRITGSQFVLGQYTAIVAGSVNGTFSTLSAPPFLAYTAVYSPTEVDVNMQSYDFRNAAASGNQHSLAGALDAIANPMASGHGGSAAADTTPWGVAMEKLSQLTSAGAVQQAYNQLSGDSLTSFYDVGLRQARLFTEGLTERAVPMDSAATLSEAPAPVQLAMAGDTGALGTGTKSKKPRGLWARALGAFETTDADSSAGSPESTANTGGFEVGYDIAPNEATVVGAFAGYTRTGVSVDDRNSTGTTNSFGFGAYGRYAPSAWFFDGSAAFIDNSNSMDRTLDFAGQTAHSSFSSPLLTLYGDAGYTFEPMADTAVEPYLALRITHLSQGGFTETDAPGENLDVDQKSINSVVPTLAVRATHLFKPESKHPFMLGGTFGLDSELGTTDRSMTATFADGTGPGFTVSGTPQKRIAADLSLGGRVAINQRWQGYGNYGFTVASEHFAQVIMGGARLTW